MKNNDNFINPEVSSIVNPDMPGILWNLSGFGCHISPLIYFLNFLNIHKGLSVIKSVHGSPNCTWNGGRPSHTSFDGNIESAIKEINGMGVGIYLTFTNRLIENKHLADTIGNYLLDLIYERPDLNGVIVVSDLLSDYIRRIKPLMPQFCSIVKITNEKGTGKLDYYKQMEERFDLVVVHPDDNFNLELLDGLDRKKAELLVNEPCLYKCPFRQEHYDIFAAHNIENNFEYLKINNDFRAQKCGASKELQKLSKGLTHRTCYLGIDDVQKLYDMGFRHFKIRGRDQDALMFMHEVFGFVINPKLQYVLKSEYDMRFLQQVNEHIFGLYDQIRNQQNQIDNMPLK